MADANLDALHAAYRAFAAGDLDAFTGLLDAGFVSTQSDAVPWRGTYRGPAGVRQMFGLVGERAAATFELGEIIDGGERIVAIGTARLTPAGTGRAHQIRELHVWRVRDGRLLSLDVFLNAPADLLAELGEPAVAGDAR